MNDIPRLHQSIAHILVNKSPAHAKRAIDYRTEPSPAMERGLIIDRLLFGCGREIAVIEADAYRTNAAKAARKEALDAGKIPVLRDSLQEYEETVSAIRSALSAQGVEFTGESQVYLKWTAPSGIECGGTLDHLQRGPSFATIYDLKTTACAHPSAITRSIVDHGYDIQHAAYVEAVETVYPQYAGRVSMEFLFVETEPPYAVQIASLAGSMAELGRRKWERAQRLWRECHRRGHWPGYSGGNVVSIEAKPWQLMEQLGEGESIEYSR